MTKYSRNAYSRKELEEAVRQADSLADVCRFLNLAVSGGGYRVIKNRIAEFNLDTAHFTRKKPSVGLRAYLESTRLKPADVLIKDSPYGGDAAKRIIKRESLIPFECYECKLTNEWQGKALVLQLEHKNGNSRDHRLENLCWLCPNCHSQTSTYAGRNPHRWKDGKKIDRRKTAGKGKEYPERRKTDYAKVTARALETKNYTQVGKEFGISGNMVKKIVRKTLNISKAPRFSTCGPKPLDQRMAI